MTQTTGSPRSPIALDKKMSDQSMAKALETLGDQALAAGKGVAMRGVAGAPDWMAHELALWKASEELREIVGQRKDLRGSSDVMRAALTLAADSRHGKGRQNIVLIIGDFAEPRAAAPILGHLLQDPDVRGHVIKALTKLKAAGYGNEIQKIFGGERTGWIRAAARRYLEKVDGGGASQ